VAPAEALAAVPDSLKSVDAAPLLCAGITTFNALPNTGAKPPDTVAILGMGGLGHLGLPRYIGSPIAVTESSA